MGMYPAIYALSDATIERLHAEPPPPPPPLELAPEEGDLGPAGDFEKSWQGLHYLLTGTAWEGEPPLNFLMGGGRELELVDGENPLLTHSSADTRRIADALVRLTDEEVRGRVNPAEMQRLEIYPEIWGEPEHVGYLLEDFRRLRETVSEVARIGLGLLVSIS
jgi:hypothetical protein